MYMVAYFLDQFMHIFHYITSLLIILVLLPRLIFLNKYNDGVERIAAEMIKMSFILIILGYLLVIFKLFEVLSIVFLLFLIGKKIYSIQRKRGSLEESLTHIEALMYDYFEGKYKLRQVISSYLFDRYSDLNTMIKESVSPPLRLVGTIMMLSIILFASSIRFYDLFIHTAPSYGNRYTTLKWIKDIRGNQFLSDGVFPQGFHIFWATIQEFTRIDALYLFNYMGPFIHILIMLSIYFVLSRLLHNRYAGVAGMMVYALLGEYIDPLYWEWQVEADAGTFAYIFIVPTLYFLITYLRGMNPDAFQAFFAGMSVIAFTHPIIFIQLSIGIGIISFTLYLTKRKIRHASVPKVFLAWSMALGLSLIPILIGVLVGKGVHPAFYQLFQSDFENRFMLTATPSVLPIVLSVLAGFVWIAISQIVARNREMLEASLLGGLFIFCLSVTTLQPIQPLKIDWDASVTSYLSIAKEYPPRAWMIVSKESFTPIVQGKGYHMNISYLVLHYNPTKPSLTRIDSEKPDMNVAPHVFIYYEKEIREESDYKKINSHFSRLYTRWKGDMQLLDEWIKMYAESKHQLDIYYEDKNLVIYHLEREEDRDQINRNIWGGEAK